MNDSGISIGAKWLNTDTGKAMVRVEGGWEELPPTEMSEWQTPTPDWRDDGSKE